MPEEMEITYDGIKKFQRELRQVGKEWPRELRKTNKAVAEETVLPEARRRAAESRPSAAGGTTRLGSRGERSLRAGAQQRKAFVKGGGARVPWFAGHEWGSSGQYGQFPQRSGVSPGFIIFPVIKERQTQIQETYMRMLDDLASRAFPE